MRWIIRIILLPIRLVLSLLIAFFHFYIKFDTTLLNVVSALDLYNTSETRSNQKSFGLNYQKTGKELMSQDEITVMDGGKCIYQLRGVRPFLSDKYDITKHKNYKLLEDYDKKNLFDVEEYLKNRDKVKLKSSYKINSLKIWVMEKVKCVKIENHP